tara:strand:- start:32 stop:1378 length:1347 start_codon:yes stop_codon:yes gene_type:complete
MFGFGYFISNLYWITNSLTFEESFKPLIPFALILVPLFLGAFYGLATLVSFLIDLKKNFSSIIIFSTILSLFEYLRSFIFGGFPWNLIIFSLTDYLPLIQLLSFVGTYSLNLLFITLCLIPTIIFFKYPNKIKIFYLIFIFLVMITNFIFGNLIIKNYEKIEETNLDTLIKVISPKISINRFLEDVNPKEILIDLINTSKPDKEKKTIFIFPEGVLSNIYLQDLKKFNYLFFENFSNNHSIILGINSYKDDKIFNSLVVIDNNTNILSKYDKNNLVPFGEFLPFENFFKKLGFKKITQGYLSFSSSNTRNLINIKNLNFLPLICYEIIFSGNINKNNNLDYDFILNISEDGWFGESIGPHQHFSHSIFRSIEEGKNIIRSANNGISAHINSKGQVIDKIITTKKGVIEVKSFKQVKKTHFITYGNKIFFYFLIIYISLIVFLKLRENK